MTTRKEIVSYVKRQIKDGVFPEYQTQDDNGLSPDEYVDLIENALRALSPPEPTELVTRLREALEPFTKTGWMTLDTEHTARTVVAHMHPESDHEIILSSEDFRRAATAYALPLQDHASYALDADLLREAIEDDGLSRSTLKIMARMKALNPTPAILDWANTVMARKHIRAMVAEEETKS